MSGAELALDVEVPGPTGGSDELKEREAEWAAPGLSSHRSWRQALSCENGSTVDHEDTAAG